MKQALILIVDDEDPIREMLSLILESAGYTCRTAENASQTFTSLTQQTPDLILLDWMLPDMNGIEIAKRLRSQTETQDIPIIMLTARGEENDRVRGLNVGADDYIVKPFSPNELLARIKAVLRRSLPVNEETLQIQNLQIDTKSQRVSGHGQVINLTPNEYRLLVFFANHLDRVYTREQLLDRVWGHDAYIDERSVDVQIRRLRKALRATGHAHLIQTIRGSGYRFSEQP